MSGITRCKYDLTPPDGHAHTHDCAELLFEHVPTGITSKSKDINECEFPKHIMEALTVSRIKIKN